MLIRFFLQSVSIIRWRKTCCIFSIRWKAGEIIRWGLFAEFPVPDLMPCAYKCMVTLKPQEHSESFRSQLLFTKKDLKRLEQLNMLLVDNIEQ